VIVFATAARLDRPAARRRSAPGARAVRDTRWLLEHLLDEIVVLRPARAVDLT